MRRAKPTDCLKNMTMTATAKNSMMIGYCYSLRNCNLSLTKSYYLRNYTTMIVTRKMNTMMSCFRWNYMMTKTRTS